MALLAAKDVPLRRVMKAFLASGVPTLALVQVLHFAGIIAPNAASERDGSYRLMFGYGPPQHLRRGGALACCWPGCCCAVPG